MAAGTPELTVLVTGAAAFVTGAGPSLAGRAAARVTGASACAAVLVTGASVLVTGVALDVAGADIAPLAIVLAGAIGVAALGANDTADVTPEATEASPDADLCADGNVAAWACRENTSMRKKK